MHAALDVDVRLLGNALVDGYLGVRYSLTPDASWLIRQLQKEGDIESLIRHVAVRRRLDISQARASLYALLGQLGAFGIVHMQWSRPSTLYAWLAVRWRWRQRRRMTFGQFWLGMLQAYGWLGLALTIPFVIARLVVGPEWPSLSMLLPAVLFGSCLVHEAGHALAARLFDLPIVLLDHIGYAAVMYKPSSLRVARVIAVAGPLMIGFLYGIFSFFCKGTLQMIFIGTAVVHLVSLLPWCADGKTIWRTI